MSLDSTLARARRRQAVQFSDTATVARPVGEPTFNPATGVSAQPVNTRYSGIPCKVKTQATQGYDVNAAQTEVRLNSREVELPLEFMGTATSFAEDDIITITDSVYNVASVGQVYRVTDVDRRTWQPCARVVVEETAVPVDWS